MSSKILKIGMLIAILCATSAAAMGKKEKSLLKFLLCPPIPIPTPKGDIRLIRPGSKSKTIHVPKPTVFLPKPKHIFPPRPTVCTPRITPPVVVCPPRTRTHTHSTHRIHCTTRVIHHPTVIIEHRTVEPEVVIIERPVREVVVERPVREVVVEETTSMIEPVPAPPMTGTTQVVEEVIIVDECPPVAVRELQPPCPAPHLIWVPGYWVHRNNSWAWASGSWVKPPAGRTAWKPGKWMAVGHAWQWRPGCWTCSAK